MEIIRRQFHGYREESGDSYVTTEFVALWFLPLWPAASYKVVKDEAGGAENQSDTIGKANRLPIQCGQACEGWAFSFALIAGFVFVVSLLYFALKFDWTE